jgi:hypothetical protein
MPFGLISSPKIVAINANLYIYVRIFRICCRSFVKFGIRYECEFVNIDADTAVLFLLSRTVRPGVHATIKSVSVPAPMSLFPAVKPRSAVHTDRQNRYRRLQGGQFRE